MEAKELMIGDWVMDTEPTYYTQVTPAMIYEGYDWEAIPLTEEILKANGFKKIDKVFCVRFVYDYIICYNIETGRLNIDWEHINSGRVIPKSIICMTVGYVHILQHALRLSGLNELADKFKLKEK